LNKEDTQQAGKTAITRTSMSAPMRWLKENNLLKGCVLDFGCGKSEDVRRLRTFGIDAVGWDPVHCCDDGVFWDTYDVITCIYVLNVIKDEEDRLEALERIRVLLKDNGVAYIVVRRDIKKEGVTCKNTWQGNIDLAMESVYKNSKFEIYKMDRSWS